MTKVEFIETSKQKGWDSAYINMYLEIADEFEVITNIPYDFSDIPEPPPKPCSFTCSEEVYNEFKDYIERENHLLKK